MKKHLIISFFLLAFNVIAYASMPPTSFTVPPTTASGQSIVIKWKAPQTTQTVTSYEVQGELSGSLANRNFTANSSGYFSLVRPPLPQGKEYCYKVRAWYGSTASAFVLKQCTIVGTLTFSAPTTFTQTSNRGFNNFIIGWSSVSGASHYLLERETSYGVWSNYSCSIKSVFINSQWLTGCEVALTSSDRIPEKNNNVVFRVSACNSNTCGNVTRLPIAIEEPEPEPVPEILEPQSFSVPANTASGQSIIIKWKAPQTTQTVTSYEVQGELKGIIENRIFTADAFGYFSLVRPSLPPGKEYCYKVKAWYGSSASEFVPKQCTTMGYIAFEAPSEVLAIGTTSGGDDFNFTIGWTAVAGANHYLLERQSNIGTWNIVNCSMTPVEINTKQLVGCNVDITSADVVPELDRMIYRISACNSSGVCGKYVRHNFELSEATYKEPVPEILEPQSFSVPATTASGGSVTIRWKAAQTTQAVTSYELQGELRGVLLNELLIPNSNGYIEVTRPALTAGREYCYKVKAWYGSTSSIFVPKQCTTVGYTAFEAPSSLSITRTGEQLFNISWSAVPGAKKYLLEQQITSSLDGDMVWQAVQYSSNTSKIQQYSNFHKNIYAKVDRIIYRVSACNDNDVCGNYVRGNTELIEDDYLLTTPSNHKSPACIDVPELVPMGSSIPISWCKPEADNVQSYELVGELSPSLLTASANELSTTSEGLITVTRPALTAGREYCYKVRAHYIGGAKSEYSETHCTTAGYIAFEAPADFLSEGTKQNADTFNFTLGWSEIAGADHYVLERESNIGVWNAVSCSINPVEIKSKSLVGCNVDLTSTDTVPGLGIMIYRVSACNNANVCGNYIRHNFELSEAINKDNLLPHSGFELGDAMLLRPASERNYEINNPITGNRSLKVVTNGYEPVYYRFSNFSELSLHLNKVTFSGTVNTTRAISVNLQVHYVGGTWGTHEANVKYIRYNYNANQSFILDVDVDPSKEVKEIYISLNSICGNCVDPVTMIIDDLSLTAETAKILLIRTDLLGTPITETNSNGVVQ